MAAQEKPSPDREPKEVRDFREKYAESLGRARVSAEHTATEGWQNIYTAHRESIQKRKDALADGLAIAVESVRQRMLTEEEEKDLADTKKALTELREMDSSFTRLVIDPIIAPMTDCHQVIEAARAEARNCSRTAPLHTRGLVEQMEEAVESVPRVKFIMASGRLIVGE